MAAEEKKGILQGVGSNVVALGVVSFLTDVSSEMIFPLLPVFITTILGAGQAALGLIEGIADSTASIIEVFSGYFSDKTGKRKQFVMFGYSLSSLVKVGIALSNQWWQMLIMRGAERIGKGIRESPRDAIIASSTAPDARGKAYGLHRAMDTLGAIVGPVIAYFILLWYGQAEPGYRTVFFAAIIPAVIAVLVLFLFVREPEKAKPAVNKTPFWESLKQMSPNYKTYLKVSLLFSLAYFSFAFFIVRANELGISAENILLLYIVYNICYAASSVPGGILSDKIGRKPVIAAAFALYAIVCVGFAFASTWLQLLVLFAVYGVFVATDESVNKAYIIDLTEEEKRGMALGAYSTAIGVAYLPASIIAGALWAMYGAPIPLFLAAGIAILAAIVFAFCCKPAKLK